MTTELFKPEKGEIWKKLSLPGYDNMYPYSISSFGRIVLHLPNKEDQLISISNIKGYPIVSLKLLNKKRLTKYLHKLTAEHFLEKQSPDQKYVTHLDYNKDNNHIENLKWVNRQQLVEHQATNPNYKKGIVRNSKLSEEQVRELKLRLLDDNTPLYQLAKEYGITHTQLNRIRSGKNWSHVKIEKE